MGYHEDIQAAIVVLLEAALPSACPVINVLAMEEAELQRYSSFVGIMRERIDFEAHKEINPSTTADTQLEEWEWSLYVCGGAGRATQAGKGAEVDLLMETVRTALNAQRPDSTCGPMSITGEEYYRDHGNGVVYQQTWRHSRMAE
jgi:hypothetical protein